MNQSKKSKDFKILTNKDDLVDDYKNAESTMYVCVFKTPATGEIMQKLTLYNLNKTGYFSRNECLELFKKMCSSLIDFELIQFYESLKMLKGE